MVKIGRSLGQSETKIQPPTTEGFYLCHLRTATVLHRKKTTARKNGGVLLMRCVEASGAPGGGRGRPETTHELSPCTRSCERVAQKLAKTLRCFFFTQGSKAQWLHCRRRNKLHSRRIVQFFSINSSRRRCCGRKKSNPIMGSKLMDPKKCKKKAQKLSILEELLQLFYSYEVRILDANPLL